MPITLPTLAERYAAVWNEPDADRRRSRIHELWTADAVHVLRPPEEIRKAAFDLGFDRPALEARGHEALEFRVRQAYQEFVAPGTFDFAEPRGYALDTLTVRDLLEARSPVVSTVLAHGIDPRTGAIELFLGRPRLNSDGGGSWMWLRPLLPRDTGMAIP